MASSTDRCLIAYGYDALDRLVNCAPTGQSRQERFYQEDRLVTEIQGGVQYQILQHQERLLAELYSGTTQRASLLVTDHQRSVLQASDARLAYPPYGHRSVAGRSASLMGFNGERADSATGHYLLGNGHRAFNPVLMRFNRPDSLSPFGKGGLNGYAYCGGDPVNRRDPTGKWNVHGWLANALLEIVGDYIVPYIPKRAVTWIPGVGNRTFGRVAKKASRIGGLFAAGAYVALNRFDAHAYSEPLYTKLFTGFLAISAASVAASAASTVHKIARKGWTATQPILVAYRTRPASVATLSESVPLHGMSNHAPAFGSWRTSNGMVTPEPAVSAIQIRSGTQSPGPDTSAIPHESTGSRSN
jgi:RHS repeat-associated protein